MQKVTVKINGMMCSVCEVHINDAVRSALPVKKVTSSRKKGQTVILIDDGAFDEMKLREKIKELGYEMLSVHEEPYEKKGLFGK